VLVDVSLPGMNGLDFVAALQNRCPDVVCLILSGHRARWYVERARELGARGYVVKGDLPGLRSALRAVLAGGFYFKNYD
jgi:DNA-binding NarL/FixJ family response regulator